VNYQQRGIKPTLGKRAKLALKISAQWSDRTDRKLITLLGAFADVGERSPYARDLAARLEISVEELDRQLDELAARGLVWTIRRSCRRTIYVLLFNGDRVPGHDFDRFAAYERQRGALKAKRERVPA
jgi:hypothetical protein